MGRVVASSVMLAATFLVGCTPSDEKSVGNAKPSPVAAAEPTTTAVVPSPSWLPCGLGRPDVSAEPDYSDFIMYAGRMYVLAVEDAKVVLGSAVGRVRCRLRGSGALNSYLPRDGDAAFVVAGTRLYAIRGRALADALAVSSNGTVAVYEVQR